MSDDQITIKFAAETSEAKAAIKDLGSSISSGLAGANDALGKLGTQSAEAAKSVASSLNRMSEGANGATVLTNAVNGVGSSLSAIGGPAGMAVAAAAAVAAALIGAAQSATNYDKEMHEFAVATGASLQQASVFSTALSLIGKSAGEAERMMFMLMRTMRTQPNVLAQIGVAAQNLDGSFRPLTDVFFDAIKSLQGYAEGIDRDMASMSVFRRGAKEMTDYMRLTADTMAEATAIANTWGLVVDEQGVMSALEYSKALNTLGLEFKGIGLAIGKEVMPYLLDFVQGLNDAANAIKGTSDGAAGAQKELSGLGQTLAVIIISVKLAVGGLKILWAAFLTVVQVVALVLEAINSLTTTLAKMMLYFATFDPTGMFDALKTGFNDVAAYAKDRAQAVENEWKAVGEYLENFSAKPKATSGGEASGAGFIGPPAPGGAGAGGASFDTGYYKREKDALDQYIAQVKATHTVSLQEERDYWQARKDVLEKAGADLIPAYSKAVQAQKDAAQQAQAYGGLDSGQVSAMQKAVEEQVAAQKAGDQERIASAEKAVNEIVGADITGNNRRLADAMHALSQMEAQNQKYTASYRQVTAEIATLDVGLEQQRLTDIRQAGEEQVNALRQQQLAARQAGDAQGQSSTKWLDNMQKVVPALDGIVKKYAELYGVSEQVVRAVLETERGLKASGEFAVSPKGAIGPGQLMPGTAEGLGVDPWNLDSNIKGSVKLLADLFQKFPNDLAKVFAGYNAGAGAVQKYGGMPPYAETQGYVQKAMGAMGGGAPGGAASGGAQVTILSQQVKLEQDLAVTEAELSAAVKERAAWQEKANADPGNEEYKAKLVALDSTITSLSTKERGEKESLEKEKLQLTINALDQEQARYKKGSDEYLAIERQKFAAVAALYASDTEQYMAAQQKLNQAVRQRADQEVKIAKEAGAMALDVKKAEIDQEKETVEQSLRLNQITAAQKTQIEQQLDQQLYAAKLQEAQKEVDLAVKTYGQVSEQAAKAYRSLLDLQLQYAGQVQKSNDQLVADYARQWQGAIQGVTSSMASGVQGMITGQETFAKATNKTWAAPGMVLQFLAKWTAEQLAALVGITLAHQAQQITITTTTAAGETVRSTITVGAVAKDMALTATKTTAAVSGETAKTTATVAGVTARAAANQPAQWPACSPRSGRRSNRLWRQPAKPSPEYSGFSHPLWGLRRPGRRRQEKRPSWAL